jgi:hypothetical protein
MTSDYRENASRCVCAPGICILHLLELYMHIASIAVGMARARLQKKSAAENIRSHAFCCPFVRCRRPTYVPAHFPPLLILLHYHHPHSHPPLSWLKRWVAAGRSLKRCIAVGSRVAKEVHSCSRRNATAENICSGKHLKPRIVLPVVAGQLSISSISAHILYNPPHSHLWWLFVFSAIFSFFLFTTEHQKK